MTEENKDGTPVQSINTEAQQVTTSQTIVPSVTLTATASNLPQATAPVAETQVQKAPTETAASNAPVYKPPQPSYSDRLNRPEPAGGVMIPQQICKALIEVVRSGDIDKFLAERAQYNIAVRDVTDSGQFGQNLIFSTIYISDEDQTIKMIKVLEGMNVDINQRDNLKQTPLYYASREGKLKVIQYLIEKGVKVNSIDTYGQNAIFYGVNLGQFEAVKLLVNYGSEADHVDENGQTPLYYAIKSERTDVLKYLLDLGAKVNITDKRGQTPVNFANRHNKPNLIKILVEYGAQPPNRKPARPAPTPVPV